MIALPAPVVTNHTQSEYWVWLEWKVRTAEYPLSFVVDNFTLCYSNLSSDSMPYNATLNSSPDNSSSLDDLQLDFSDLWTPEDCLFIEHGGQRSANVSGLLAGVGYVIQVGYVSTEGLSSAWSEAVTVETLIGK